MDKCFCGANLIGSYAKMTGECVKCEDSREAETAFSMLCDQRYEEKPFISCGGVGVNYEIGSDGRIRFT